MKILLAILVIFLVVASLIADYKWRQWIAAPPPRPSIAATTFRLPPVTIFSKGAVQQPCFISIAKPTLSQFALTAPPWPFPRRRAFPAPPPPPTPSSARRLPGTQVHDPAALRPPAGARVAIVEFEDMECPDCGRANPLLKEAAANYHIPWIRHDFPLPFHAWSFNAAVNARFFDTKSKAIGDEYRDEVFANQLSITSPDSSASSPRPSPTNTKSLSPSPSTRRASSPP